LKGKGSSSNHPPDCFGPFSVRADRGASGYGRVYLARDPSTNRRVIIRTFELSRQWRELGKQSELLDSFRTLCESALDHPSLARPLAFGAEANIPYLVYSDLAGTAMDVVMQRDGPRPLAEVLQRARQLADAIDLAAGAGVHHGMMAPCDVILDGERTGVTGFGLAPALIKVGVPAKADSPYGSPQRLAGAPPTLADDVYSLAAITIELLIGTPKDPDDDMSSALRQAQGLAERRRVRRPALHETRLFTTIAGVDAGKLRAAFAAAFSDEPSERPSTAAELVASLEDAMSDRRRTEDSVPSASAVPIVSDTREEPPYAPVLDTKRAEDEAPLEPPSPEPVVAEGRARRRRRRRKRVAMSQPLIAGVNEHESRERKPETRLVRLEPIVDDALVADVRRLPARSISEASYGIPGQSGSRALLVTVVVGFSFGAGFGGGFIAGQHSSPSTESIDVSRQEPVAERQLTHAAVEDPEPLASTTQAVAPISKGMLSSSKPMGATTQTVAAVSKASSSKLIGATVARQSALPAVESGRLRVRSTPAGASVLVDGESRGVTPLDLGNLALGAHAIEVSYPDHNKRQRRVTLTKQRPARSLDFTLRPTSAPAEATSAANSPGSLQVTSHPAGAHVFVDDSLIGTAPLLLSNVAAGSRRLRVELSGYQIWTKSVQIEPSARLRVSARLEP
jgi:serine/threonine protein kinase